MISKSTLKALIPRGKQQKVAEKAGVSSAAVSKYLDDKTKSSFKIYKAALEVAKEYQEEVSELESCLTLNQ